jgi:putative permease
MLLSHSLDNKPFVKVLAIVCLIILGFWIASFFPDLVITLIISTLTAFILKPLVQFLEYRFGVKRWIAITSIFLIVGGMVVFLLIEAIPFLVNHIRLMYEQLKNFPFEAKFTLAAKEMTTHIPFVNPTTIGDKVHTGIQKLLDSLGETTGTVASYLVNLVIIPFIAYFILAEGDIGLKKLIERIPNKYFEMSLNILCKLQHELVFYLRGLLIECTIVGGLSVIGFIIIGIPYAILIGMLAGIANLVPYLGFIAGAGLALIASLTQTGDYSMLAPIVILTVAIRLIDYLFLRPFCYSKSSNLHPVVVILALIIGYNLMGIAGMVISIPIATILRVSASEAYWGFKHYTITA